MIGTVYKSTGSWYTVKLDETQKFIECRIIGKLRLDEKIKTTNPVVVGDRVKISKEEGLSTASITEILKRDNYIIRQSPRKPHLNQIIAANMDQALLVSSIKKPRTRTGFIDRFLITAEMYHIPCILIFNKKDIYKDKDFERYEELKGIYEAIGYQCVLISVEEQDNIDGVRALLDNKISLLSGQSGVGKSSLMNALMPELNIATKAVSKHSEKGLHTTTFATMYDLPEGGGKIIDTPGIKELALVDLEAAEVSHYYPEMRKHLQDCHFHNCIHFDEPASKCAVKQAFGRGEIAEVRYAHYMKIIGEMKGME